MPTLYKFRKQILSLGLACMAIVANAQDATTGVKKDYSPFFNWVYENIILVMGFVILIAGMLLLFRLVNNMFKFYQSELLRERGVSVEEVEKAKPLGLFEQFNKSMWKLKPMEQEADIDLGHDYDGIRELDNILPPWWVYLFYFTIGFAVVYLYVYHWSDIGINQKEEYEVAMEEAEIEKLAYLATQANSVDETNVVALTDAGDLASGKEIFLASCAACHGQLGEGGVGPNMTDAYWIHGGSVKDIFKTIKYGVPEKGMIAWQTQMQPASMQKVSSYILTLQGTNPPNQKEPQGELYTPSEEEAVQLTKNEEEAN